MAKHSDKLLTVLRFRGLQVLQPAKTKTKAKKAFRMAASPGQAEGAKPPKGRGGEKETNQTLKLKRKLLSQKFG